MSKIRLKSLLSSALLLQFFLLNYQKFLTPYYSPYEIDKMHAIQQYVLQFEDKDEEKLTVGGFARFKFTKAYNIKLMVSRCASVVSDKQNVFAVEISTNALQSDPRVAAFLRSVNRQVGRPRPVMVIVYPEPGPLGWYFSQVSPIICQYPKKFHRELANLEFQKSYDPPVGRIVRNGRTRTIPAGEGDFLWIKNFMCNVIEYDMLTRISVVTIDRVTTASIAKEMPMMPLFELSFAQFTEQMEQLYADKVKERLLDILKLRIGALVLKNKVDALIGVPNQLWTNYFLNRTMYPPVFDLDEESLLVQKLDPLDKESTMIDSASFIGLGRFNPRGARILTRSADLASKKFTTASSALTYACDVPKRNICRRLSAKRMIGPSWFGSKRDLLPDIVHLPKNAERAALRGEGLWLLSKDGKCNDVARRKLNSSLLHGMANWKEYYKTRNSAEFRFRFRPPHPMGHRSFLEESAAKDL